MTLLIYYLVLFFLDENRPDGIWIFVIFIAVVHFKKQLHVRRAIRSVCLKTGKSKIRKR